MSSDRRRVAVVVAHPDDEVVFFGGTVARLVGVGCGVDVICVTSDFGPATSLRRAELSRSCWLLGARARLLRLADAPSALDSEALASELERRVAWHHYRAVLTHGIWGEYGHPHHQQVSRAVHRASPFPVWSLAGPLQTQHFVALSPGELARKRSIAARCHRSQPFAVDWCTATEAFVHLGSAEAEALSAVVAGERPPVDAALAALLLEAREALDHRRSPFAEVDALGPHVWAELCDGSRGAISAALGPPGRPPGPAWGLAPGARGTCRNTARDPGPRTGGGRRPTRPT